MFKILLSAILPLLISAHSWAECTDYKINNDTDKYYFNKDNCLARPRCAWNAVLDEDKSGFGADSAMQFVRDVNSCQCEKNNLKNYTIEAPMAKYVSGQEVCIAYPAKNHVAEECQVSPHFNKFLPDGGLTIKMTSLPNSEIYDMEMPNKNGVHVKNTIDYNGFQNCPKFCENPDRALCTVCFNLHDNTTEGIYSFKWVWEFNPGEYYVTCWDALIEKNISAEVITNMPAPCDDHNNLTNFPTTSPTQTPVITTIEPSVTPAQTIIITEAPVPTISVTPSPTPAETVIITESPSPTIITPVPTPATTTVIPEITTVTPSPTPATTTTDDLINLLCAGV
jgi:hypothetical protein